MRVPLLLENGTIKALSCQRWRLPRNSGHELRVLIVVLIGSANGTGHLNNGFFNQSAPFDALELQESRFIPRFQGGTQRFEALAEHGEPGVLHSHALEDLQRCLQVLLI